MTKHSYLYIILLGSAFMLGCKKFLDIGVPQDSVTTEVVFSDSASASSGLLGIYTKIMGGVGFLPLPTFGSGTVTIGGGESADEFAPYNTSDQTFYTNTLTSQNSTVGQMWTDGYSYIYQANICIEALAKSSLSSSVQTRFTAEARFLRAFFYFYLTNLYGDIPYTETSNWKLSFGHGRTKQADVYNKIISDLTFAANNLPDNFPPDGRLRPIKLAATAMLARVSLYQRNWADAERYASLVINSPLFSNGLTTLANVFLKNNTEAIWQLQPVVPNYNTPEGYGMVATNQPSYFLDSVLIAAFEPGDGRFVNWVNTVTTNNIKYYSPYKYKIRTSSGSTTITEYYNMLRLAEQFLIRAEARVQQSNLSGALADLNVVRQRAGLTSLPNTLDQNACIAAVAQERRIELFSEWGHRWFDLKRTGKASEVLSKIKPKWTDAAALYPIPYSELKNDPTLTQTPGY